MAAAGLGLWAYWLAKSDMLPPVAAVHVELADMSAAELAAVPFDEWIQTKPIEAIEAGILRHRQNVVGYTCVMAKQERIDGKLKPPEVVNCWYRAEPRAVMMEWASGQVQADASLWVPGENGGKILVRPASRLKLKALNVFGNWYAARSPDDPEVREASRYAVSQFGLGAGMERTYAAWNNANEAGTLHFQYKGLAPCADLDGKPVHTLVRDVDPPEEDGLTKIILRFDPDTWLQVGSELYAGEALLGRYYFRDIKLNPEFEPVRFRPEILKK